MGWNIPSSVGKMAPGTYQGWKGAQPTPRQIPAVPPKANAEAAVMYQVTVQGVDSDNENGDGLASGARAFSLDFFGTLTLSTPILAVLVYRADAVSPAIPALSCPNVDSFPLVASVVFSGAGSDRYRLAAFAADGLPAGTVSTETITVTPGDGGSCAIGILETSAFITPVNGGLANLGAIATGTGTGAAPTVAAPPGSGKNGALILLAVATGKGSSVTPIALDVNYAGWFPTRTTFIEPAASVLADLTAWNLGPDDNSFDRDPGDPADFVFSDYGPSGSPPFETGSGSGSDTSDGYGWIRIQVPASVLIP